MTNKQNGQSAAERERKITDRIEKLYQEMLCCSDQDTAEKIAGQIADLQGEDGAWGEIAARRGDHDIRVAYVYFPTYYATAALMRFAVLYDWMTLYSEQEPEFCEMIGEIIEKYRWAVTTGHTRSDWDRDFRMEFEQEIEDYGAVRS